MKKILLITTATLMLYSCGNKYELKMDRAALFYERGEYESAMLEYKNVINDHPTDIHALDNNTIHMLANAHHNLAVIHLKRAYKTEDLVEKSSYLEQANYEAQTAYYLYPMDVYKNTMDSIKRELNL